MSDQPNKTYSEGDCCPQPDCPGRLVIEPPVNCSCHISSPCYACENNPLVCDHCGWQSEEAM